ncbi:ABC transporter ATP-binding protein [Bacillus dakarensis]|uniref:ABC transporter ATP-binding protein n=1 Tax=Robertmurraya dakarensis TaxID=1926278 RepID=UPI0009822E0A|nr:ABC transporter ATP-binding protein [Bacillus dakarensis]
MLNIQDLCVNYEKNQVIKGISMEVKEGEIVTLIGANGAGKTTLLRTISGIKSSSSGSIEFMGNPIHKMPSHKIVDLGIGHIPEGRRVFPEMTVKENLEMGAYRRKDSKEMKKELDHIFELFPRLKERISQRAGTLSGGEQQMLAIGRAIMLRPKVYLFDEPSLGIAPLVIAEIAQMIKRLNEEEGATILLVEQNANLALKLSHRAYILETGKISLEGPSEELANDDRVQKIYLGYE